MNDYNKQLEETIAKQATIIDTLRKVNEELVGKYNNLATKYNTVASLLNACGVRETKMENGGEAWCLTMQIGDLPNPKEKLQDSGVDPETFTEPVEHIKQDGDTVVWEVKPNT